MLLRIRPGEAPFTVGVVSDSWYETLPEHLADSPAVHLATLTGWRVWNMSQGGTGYRNPAGVGGRSAFGSPDRLQRLAEAPIDLLLVNGSGNDGFRTPEEYEQDALDYYAAVAAVRPDLPIVVAGVEPLYYFRIPQGEALNDALRRAAAAAPNVVGFVDGYGEGWLTGSGSIARPQGDGNQDTYIARDDYHLSGDGARFWVGLTVERIAAMRLPADGNDGAPGR